ncbi:LA_2272 family surface repeat-containing protein [Pigmentibacter ruber]
MSKILSFLFLLCISLNLYAQKINQQKELEINSIPTKYSLLKFTIYSPYTDLSLAFTDENYKKIIENISIGLINNSAENIIGLGISLGVLKVKNNFYGLGISSIHFSENEFNGLQIGLYSQVALMNGAQLSFLANSNIVNGIQLSVVNFVDDLNGIQIAPVTNFAKNINGLQLGIYNHADEVSGVQIGIVNYAKKVYGSQIGLINIAEDSHGLSLGTLFSMDQTNGFAKVYFASENYFPFNYGLKIGNNLLYSIIEASPNNYNIDKRILALSLLNYSFLFFPFDFNVSFGLGTQLSIDKIFLALELKWLNVAEQDKSKSIGEHFSLHYSLLTGYRLSKQTESFLKFSVYDLNIPGKFELINVPNYLPNAQYLFTLGFGFQFFIFGSDRF